MNIEKAYSKTLQTNITVDELNYLINQKNLEIEKNDFECPSCKQSITCINMGKYKHLGQCKKKTHFRLNGLHKSNCIYENSDVRPVEYETDNLNYSVHPSRVFQLNLGDNGFSIPNNPPKVSNRTNDSSVSTRNQHVYTSETKNQRKESSSINSLKKLIDMFNSPDYDNNEKSIQINQEWISLNDIFFNIDLNNEVSNELRVYFGNASIDGPFKLNTSLYYTIKFSKPVSYIDKNLKDNMSFIIFENELKNTPHTKNLLNYSNNDNFTLFVLGFPTISKNKYIDIDYGNYNIFNIRISD